MCIFLGIAIIFSVQIIAQYFSFSRLCLLSCIKILVNLQLIEGIDAHLDEDCGDDSDYDAFKQ